MNKKEFLANLRNALSGLPQDEIEERLTFYAEMLDDRMEEGLSEEEAVLAAGPIDDIVKQVVAEVPLPKIAKEKIRPKRQLSWLEILLLVLGSPLWGSLILAVVVSILAVYVSLWAIIVSLWAVFASFILCAAGLTLYCIIFCLLGEFIAGLAVLGAGMICSGLSIFMFYACKVITAGIVKLTKKFTLWVKNCFIGKEKAQ